MFVCCLSYLLIQTAGQFGLRQPVFTKWKAFDNIGSGEMFKFSLFFNTLTATPDIRSLPLPPQLCCGAAVSSVTAANGGGWCVFCSF